MGLQKRLGYKARKKDSPRKRTVRTETSRWEEWDGGEESTLCALSQDSNFTLEVVWTLFSDSPHYKHMLGCILSFPVLDSCLLVLPNFLLMLISRITMLTTMASRTITVTGTSCQFHGSWVGFLIHVEITSRGLPNKCTVRLLDPEE